MKAITMMMLLAMTFVATGPVPAVQAGSCAAVEDDKGWGGTKVSCDKGLGCGRVNTLYVAVFGNDKDAEVGGTYNCGNAVAWCSSNTNVCAGASGVLTETNDVGKCKGESDEAWSSMVAIVCVSTGARHGAEEDPVDVICEFQPNWPPCDNDDIDVPEAIRLTCERDNPELGDLSDRERMLLYGPLLGAAGLEFYQSKLYYPDGSILHVAGSVGRTITCEAIQ